MKILKNKIFTLIIILLTITSTLNIVSAQEEGNITIASSSEEEKLKSEEDRTGDLVSASEDGHFNISFNDGYSGYCIEYREEEAVEGSNFTVQDTDLAINRINGKSVGNELKTFFVDYYDVAMEDKIKTQHIIWHFTDEFTGWRVDPELMEMIRKSASEKVIPDHGAVKKINNTTEAVFDFEVLTSFNPANQNYFAYKITYRDIIELIENETNQTYPPLSGQNSTTDNNESKDENSNPTQKDNKTATSTNKTEAEINPLIKNYSTDSSNQNTESGKEGSQYTFNLKKHVTGYNYIPAIIILFFGTLLIIKYSRD